MYLNNYPPFIQTLLQAGAEVYEVGGSLRDEILGLAHKDLDLVIRLLPFSELQQILQKQGHLELVGKSFGVLKFIPKGENKTYDLAYPRQEKSTGSGHRDFEVSFDPHLPLEVDLQRRDFTMNAIAKNLATGEILDPFEGRKDLEKKLIRQVFEKAFVEDPLRMLRALQFSARFHLKIEEKTFSSIKKNAPLIQSISAERVVEELKKLFSSDQPSLGFRIFQESGLLSFLFPHLVDHPNFEDFLDKLDGLVSLVFLSFPKNLFNLFTFLFLKNNQETYFNEAETWLRKYPLSMIGIEQASLLKILKYWETSLSSQNSDFELRQFMHHLGLDLLFHYLDLKTLWSQDSTFELRSRANKLLEQSPPLQISDLAIQGKDLLHLGFQPGPLLGKILKDILLVVLKDPEFNQKEYLETYVRKNFAVSD